MNRLPSLLMALSLAGAAASLVPAQDQPPPLQERLAGFIRAGWVDVPTHELYERLFPPQAELQRVEAVEGGWRLYFKNELMERVWTPESHAQLLTALREAAGDAIAAGATIEVMVNYPANSEGYLPLADLVTSRENIARRHQAGTVKPAPAAPVVQRVDYAGPPRTGGLVGRHVLLSPSHGWTWHQENRWQQQRARVFTIVEDLFTLSYINPFLSPMLENAGAVVYNTRERDIQMGEVIVDNDAQSARSRFEVSGDWGTATAAGWRGGRPAVLLPQDQPFRAGTTLQAPVVAGAPATAVFTPYIPHWGTYAVTMAWGADPLNSHAVPVTIRHRGGETRVLVNQQVSGNTWVHLGFFDFDQGANPERGSVVVTTEGAATSAEAARRGAATLVNIDAVRFGGGMGNVAGDNQISGKPRYAEGARYFLQYAGAPPAEVYLRKFRQPHFGPDYWSDISSRPEWANYLHGAPNGPNDFRQHPGLGVPIDMTIGWHTDAGHSSKGLVGTLTIYCVADEMRRTEFPDGRSRWLNRDLASLIHDEIHRTATANYTSIWQRRMLWDRDYAEVRRPNMPSVLLELLSHHNFNDMKYGLDPRFRFDMSRAIYKATLRFIAWSNGYDPIIQPLPPAALSARHLGNGEVELRWQAVQDPLEPTATPTAFIVYRSADGHAFDNGTMTTSNPLRMTGIEAGRPHYFRVTAANAGGESFPTPVVGVRWADGAEPILVVDGFNRVSGPAILHDERMRGFDRRLDPGVGWGYNLGLVGDQYDFDEASEWINDLETPGRGASLSDRENLLERGNFFNHIAIQGESLHKAGLAFDSMVAGALAMPGPRPSYRVVSWIAGEQRTTPPPVGFETAGMPDRMRHEFPVLDAPALSFLEAHLANGGRLLISGAYVAEDLTTSALSTPASQRFARERLGIQTWKGRATRINNVAALPEAPGLALLPVFRFGIDLEVPINILPTVYTVESAEGYSPTPAGRALLRYLDTGETAAVATANTITVGFPLETVQRPEYRHELFNALLRELAGMSHQSILTPTPRP